VLGRFIILPKVEEMIYKELFPPFTNDTTLHSALLSRDDGGPLGAARLAYAEASGHLNSKTPMKHSRLMLKDFLHVCCDTPPNSLMILGQLAPNLPTSPSRWLDNRNHDSDQTALEIYFPARSRNRCCLVPQRPTFLGATEYAVRS